MATTEQQQQHAAHHHQSSSRTERIPSMLQAVFLRSNRGEEVKVAPPQRLAQRSFFGNWWFKRTHKIDDKQKKIYDKHHDKVLVKTSRKMNKQQQKQQQQLKQQQQQEAETSTVSVTVAASPKVEEKPTYTLQEYFDALLKERGYQPTIYNTLETGYHNKSTPLQMASYGPRMVQIIKDSNVLALRETLAVGLSPNPCNQFGESLLHMICRRGNKELLDVMLEAGSQLSVCDDYGRTVLHDAFWAANPAFEVVSTLLKRDPGLFFLKDRRGALPLSYVTKSHWTAWMEWFDQHLDEFFPEDKAKTFTPCDLVLLQPNTFVAPDPKSDLGLELLQMVARGDLSPVEARLMAETAGQDDEEEATVANTIGDDDTLKDDYDSEDESDFDSDDDSDDSDFDSDYDSECDFEAEDLDILNEEDLREMLRMAGMARKAEMSRPVPSAAAASSN